MTDLGLLYDTLDVRFGAVTPEPLREACRRQWCVMLADVADDVERALIGALQSRPDKRPMDAEVYKIAAGLQTEIGRIAARVALRHRVTVEAMVSKGRLQHVCEARFEAYAIAADAGHSTPKIGRFFNRDHTTVLSGIDRWRELCDS